MATVTGNPQCYLRISHQVFNCLFANVYLVYFFNDTYRGGIIMWSIWR